MAARFQPPADETLPPVAGLEGSQPLYENGRQGLWQRQRPDQEAISLGQDLPIPPALIFHAARSVVYLFGKCLSLRFLFPVAEVD